MGLASEVSNYRELMCDANDKFGGEQEYELSLMQIK